MILNCPIDQQDVRLVHLMGMIDRIDAIYVVSPDNDNRESQRKGMEKFKGFFTDVQQLIDTLQRDLALSTHNSFKASIISTVSSSTDELEVSFMYSKILVDLLRRIDYDEPDRKDFFAFLRENYQGNSVALGKIDQFEEQYQEHTPIWWYTRENCIFRVLNKALKTFDAVRMIKLGCFLRDLYREIVDLYAKADRSRKLTVYQGRRMTKDQFNEFRRRKGGLMSFPSVLSTTTDQSIALQSAESTRGELDRIGVLVEMEIDPTLCSTPFAILSEESDLDDIENEVLFSPHTVFRMDEVKEIKDGLWQVHFTLTREYEEQLNLFTHYIRTDLKDLPPRESVAVLLHKMGRYQDAIDIFHRIIRSYDENNNSESSTRVCNNLGSIYDSMEDSLTALTWYNRALEHQRKTFPADDPSLVPICSNLAMVHRSLGDYATALKYGEKALAIRLVSSTCSPSSLITIHSNLGKIYESMGDYAKALACYKEADEIERTSLPSDHPSLTTTLNNFGGIYSLLGDYPTALLFYEKTLRMNSTYLPSLHPLTATAYNNVGYMNYLMGDYSAALFAYEEAVKIQEKVLPANQLSLAATYNNIGMVHRLMGDYPKALSFYEKTLTIEAAILPPKHPTLAVTLNNVGALHQTMGNLPDALSLFKKTLEIWRSTLPSNHPSLAVVHNNLGSVYDRMDDGEKALSCYRTAVAILEEATGNSPLDLANTYSNMGEVYRSRGGYNSALGFYQKSLAIEEEHLSSDHPTLGSTYSNIATALEGDKQYEQAIVYARRAIDIFSHAFGPDHAQTRENQRLLNELLLKL